MAVNLFRVLEIGNLDKWIEEKDTQFTPKPYVCHIYIALTQKR